MVTFSEVLYIVVHLGVGQEHGYEIVLDLAYGLNFGALYATFSAIPVGTVSSATFGRKSAEHLRKLKKHMSPPFLRKCN